MKSFQRFIFLFLIAIITYTFTFAQSADGINSDDARNAHQSGTEYLNHGDYNNAIMMYSQAVNYDPSSVLLRRDLAYAYYLSGNKDKAKEVIDPVLSSDYADEQTFQVASAIEMALGNKKQSEKLINRGLKRFPMSGILYYAKGNLSRSKDGSATKDAINAWQKGISADPAYPNNYYSAASYYATHQKPLWAALYAETFICLEPNTPRTVDMKKTLLQAYRDMQTTFLVSDLPSFNKQHSNVSSNNKHDFETNLKNEMIQNAASITGGINTESLIMLRTRLAADWKNNFSDTYYYSLFSYFDKLLRKGYFDAYNQWLFGATENSQEFSLWIKNNQKEYSEFETWFNNNPYMPSVSDPKPE